MIKVNRHNQINLWVRTNNNNNNNKNKIHYSRNSKISQNLTTYYFKKIKTINEIIYFLANVN
jgi:hypothetical protein